MKTRVRIQIIGNYLNRIRYSLNRAGIFTEDFLCEGNPLGFVSLSDEKWSVTFPDNIKTINNKVTQLTIKKNLSSYLSHDECTFESNEIKPEIGKTLRYKNTSSYVIICNTNLVYPLFLYKDNLYSDTSPKNKFSKYLQQKGALNIVSSPSFHDVRKYFDKYIEILLKEYDRNHIILIKTAPSLWYLEEGSFKQFNDKVQKLRSFIIEADNYFIEKTRCVVVDTFERCLPDGFSRESFLPCAFYPAFAYEELSADIISVIQDRNYIGKHTGSNHIDIDEIIKNFMLSRHSAPQYDFRKIAFDLLHNSNCPVVKQSLCRYKSNREFLNRYPCFQGCIPEVNGTYIRVSDEYILGILPEQDDPFQLVPFNNKDTVDEEKVINSGYCCSIHEAEALCKSIKFYVQRAKRGEGNHPVKLQYESENSFIQSLFVLDYKYLLGNEPFLIGMEEAAANDFCVRTNLEFLFSENSRIVRIRNGLADQISQYLLSKCIGYEGMDIYYDDLHARSVNADHLGYELDKIIIEKIDKKCFSNILSYELVKRFDNHEMDLPDVLFDAGAYQLLAVSDKWLTNYSGYKKCSKVSYELKPEHEYENLKYFVRGFGPYCTHYYSVIRPELLLLHYPLCLNQLCQFPEFDDETNSRLQQEMNRCTAVGVHIRKGDYIWWGETNTNYYREAISKILTIPEYSGANVYVFSDDIPWCRVNAEVLGLFQVAKDKLTYISHNKGDDSFRDMQLLTRCNVIIGQQGGFASMAYVLSNKSEMFITPDKTVSELLSKIGRKNKYVINLETSYCSTWRNLAEDDLEKLRRELNSIRNSWSFRLGRIVTYLPRKIRAYMKR